jgi:hypothetical protein
VSLAAINKFAGKAIRRQYGRNSTKYLLWSYCCLWQLTVFSRNKVINSVTKKTMVKLLSRMPECNLKYACIHLIFPAHAQCMIKYTHIGFSMPRIQQRHTSAVRWNMLEVCALCRNLNQTWVIVSSFLWKKNFQGKSKDMQCMPCIHGLHATASFWYSS